jgi:hypothetical protein
MVEPDQPAPTAPETRKSRSVHRLALRPCDVQLSEPVEPVHAAGAPIGFSLVSLVYFKRFRFTPPLRTAACFLTVVMALDAGVVAPVFEGSYAMFASPLGTWVPFALIFVATYATGVVVARRDSASSR